MACISRDGRSLLGGSGRFLGRGLYDAESPIALRLFTLDRGEAIDAARKVVYARGDYFDDVTSREEGVRDEAGPEAARMYAEQRQLWAEIEARHGLWQAGLMGVHSFLAALDGEQAQDALQEAYVRAWQRWDRVSAYEDPEGWVRTVAYRQCVSVWRRPGWRSRRTFSGGSRST